MANLKFKTLNKSTEATDSPDNINITTESYSQIALGTAANTENLKGLTPASNSFDPIFGDEKIILNTLGGDDNVFIDNTLGTTQSSVSNATIVTGTGNDIASIKSSLGVYGALAAVLDLGDGDDKLGFSNNSISANNGTSLFAKYSYIHLGAGNDQLKQGYIPKFNWSTGFKYCFEDTKIDAGSGDDQLYIWNAANTYINGGTGYDTIKLYGSAKDWDIKYEKKSARQRF